MQVTDHTQAGLDTWITRLERYEVAQSNAAAEVRTAIKTLDEALEREEAEAVRRADEERQRAAEEERRLVAEHDRLAREEAERQRLADEMEAAERRLQEEEQRLQDNRIHGQHDKDDDNNEEEDTEEEEDDCEVPVDEPAARGKKHDPPVIAGREKVSASASIMEIIND